MRDAAFLQRLLASEGEQPGRWSDSLDLLHLECGGQSLTRRCRGQARLKLCLIETCSLSRSFWPRKMTIHVHLVKDFADEGR